MVFLEATVFFLVVPAGAFGLMAVSVLNAHAQLKSQDVSPASQQPTGRILVLLSAGASIVVYGLVSWTVATGVEQDSGPLTSRDANLAFWLGFMWAWISVTAIAVQGWILRSRVADIVGQNFGRVLITLVPPLAAVVFALVVVKQVFARVPLAASVADSRVDAVVIALLIFALGSLGQPAVTAIANRLRDIAAPQNFRRIILLGEVALLPSIATLAWTLLQIGSL